jgi:hypothetical protein
MTVPDEPDEIDRALEAIRGEYYEPPTAEDLTGLDPVDLAVGIAYGFEDWIDASVAANSHRYVNSAGEHWAQSHVSAEFLAGAVGDDELALAHRRLMERAHSDCLSCWHRLSTLADEPGVPDSIDFVWADIAVPVHRSDTGPTEVRFGEEELIRMLLPRLDAEVEVFGLGDSQWHVTVRQPEATTGTLQIHWTEDAGTSTHPIAFRNGAASVTVAAPAVAPLSRPSRVGLNLNRSTTDG